MVKSPIQLMFWNSSRYFVMSIIMLFIAVFIGMSRGTHWEINSGQNLTRNAWVTGQNQTWQTVQITSQCGIMAGMQSRLRLHGRSCKYLPMWYQFANFSSMMVATKYGPRDHAGWYIINVWCCLTLYIYYQIIILVLWLFHWTDAKVQLASPTFPI